MRKMWFRNGKFKHTIKSILSMNWKFLIVFYIAIGPWKLFFHPTIVHMLPGIMDVYEIEATCSCGKVAQLNVHFTTSIAWCSVMLVWKFKVLKNVIKFFSIYAASICSFKTVKVDIKLYNFKEEGEIGSLLMLE